ncbi:MAG: hypothetical protein MUF54_21940, partial [Polyangiaceae bacterium]|nr:hypothetical protein [Polyangiaceae bacterium]
MSSPELRELTWSFDGTPVGEMRVVVAIPGHASAANKLPVVIAMHGQGESLKGPEKGARGWIDDYWLPRAVRRLHAPPLRAKDFRGFVDPVRLARLNRDLSTRPYRGVIVVCPYTPFSIFKGERAFKDAGLLADFFVHTLLPKVYAETPAVGTPATTGVDGVSLGGRAAVLVGFERPEAFGVVAALQPAFDVQDASELAR